MQLFLGRQLFHQSVEDFGVEAQRFAKLLFADTRKQGVRRVELCHRFFGNPPEFRNDRVSDQDVPKAQKLLRRNSRLEATLKLCGRPSGFHRRVGNRQPLLAAALHSRRQSLLGRPRT